MRVGLDLNYYPQYSPLLCPILTGAQYTMGGVKFRTCSLDAAVNNSTASATGTEVCILTPIRCCATKADAELVYL